jgi:hypothetical protein
MSTIFEAVIAVGLSVWLGLSVLKQFRHAPWSRTLKRLDRTGVLPDWRLFAPSPARSDYRLLYRDMSASGTLTSWKEIDFRNHSGWRAVWHPERRIRKGLSVSIAALIRHATAAGTFERRRLLGTSYLLILNFVEKQPRDFRAVRRQFVVAQTYGFGSDGDPRLVFLSAFHFLPEAERSRCSAR